MSNEEKMDEGRVSLKRRRMDSEDDEALEIASGYDELDGAEEEEWTEYESEDLGFEQDIETHEYHISGDITRTVKIRFFLTEESEFNWLRNLVAECTCDGVVVATALARYIDRETIRSDFWQKMEVPSEEMCVVTFDVFDRYGTVRTKYKDHPVQRGAGVWGNELDYGPLLLVETLHVKAPELRRRGLGQEMLSLVLEKAKQLCLYEEGDGKDADHFYGSIEAFEREWNLHAIVSPGILTADIRPQLRGKSAEERLVTRDRAQSGAIDFWRSCGFRRIGASHCFAFSFDLHHQSRALTAASDFDPRRSHAKDLQDEELQAIYETDDSTDLEKLEIERLRDALPLHYAALTLTDQELEAFFVTQSDDQSGWNRVTNSEATLLHLTACEFKPQSTRWLLDNIQHAESWKAARDINGYTPFEALNEKLETIRTRRQLGLFNVLNLADRFEGNPVTAVSCLSFLLGQNSSGPDIARLRYGCTCGRCIGGYISARMSCSLIFQGETTYDLLQDNIENGSSWVNLNDFKLEHLDAKVRENLKTNISLRIGFANIFQIAVECLQANIPPTAENLQWRCRIRGEWPPHTRRYFRRAGTQMGCRAVLREMFDAAEQQDEKAGDGECQRILKTTWSDLPTCRNDHEFEFVARRCGYGDDSIPLAFH